MKKINIKEANSNLLKNGFYVINQFLNSNELELVKESFYYYISKLKNNNYSFNSKQVTLFFELINNDSFFLKLLSNKDLVKIRNNYYKFWFRKNSFDIKNFEKIDLESNQKLGKSNNSIFHYDRIPSIKIQIYLNDISDKNGAISFVNNTQFYMRLLAKKNLNINKNPLYLKNYYAGKIDDNCISTIEAKQGTAIIFDTMTLHKGGEIAEGFRDVIRLVSNIPEVSKEFFNVEPNDNCIEINEEYFVHPFKHEDKNKVNSKYIYKS